MKFTDKLRNICQFLFNQRGSGTTTLIKKISDENDVYVLVPNEQIKKVFGKNAISINDIYYNVRLSPKPVLMDNSMLLELVDNSLKEINYLKTKVYKRNQFIKKIKEDIDQFYRENKENEF